MTHNHKLSIQEKNNDEDEISFSINKQKLKDLEPKTETPTNRKHQQEISENSAIFAIASVFLIFVLFLCISIYLGGTLYKQNNTSSQNNNKSHQTIEHSTEKESGIVLFFDRD